MLALNAFVHLEFIGEHMTIRQGEPVNMSDERFGLRVVDNLQMNLFTQLSNCAQHRRTIIGILASPVLLGSPIPRWSSAF
jgi:hypothetical protein